MVPDHVNPSIVQRGDVAPHSEYDFIFAGVGVKQNTSSIAAETHLVKERNNIILVPQSSLLICALSVECSAICTCLASSLKDGIQEQRLCTGPLGSTIAIREVVP